MMVIANNAKGFVWLAFSDWCDESYCNPGDTEYCGSYQFTSNTGVILPFISYGGTSIIFPMAEIGLVLSVSRGIGLENV